MRRPSRLGFLRVSDHAADAGGCPGRTFKESAPLAVVPGVKRHRAEISDHCPHQAALYARAGRLCPRILATSLLLRSPDDRKGLHLAGVFCSGKQSATFWLRLGEGASGSEFVQVRAALRLTARGRRLVGTAQMPTRGRSRNGRVGTARSRPPGLPLRLAKGGGVDPRNRGALPVSGHRQPRESLPR